MLTRHNLSAHDPAQSSDEDRIKSQILMGELQCHGIPEMHSDPSEVIFRCTEAGINEVVSHLRGRWKWSTLDIVRNKKIRTVLHPMMADIQLLL